MANLEDKLLGEKRGLDSRSLSQKIKDLYFAPKSFERSGKIYEYLGVKQFKKLLMNWYDAPLGGASDRPSNYHIGKNHSIQSIKNFEKQTRWNEEIHLISPALGSSPFIASLFLGDHNLVVLAGAASSIMGLLNVYPIMLQRYNRARIYNVLEKKGE